MIYRPTGSDEMPPMADDIHGKAVMRCRPTGSDEIHDEAVMRYNALR